MQLEPIIWLLANAGVGLTTGVNLFQDFMPAIVKTGVVVMTPLGGNRIDWELGPQWRKDDSFQVISRAATKQISLSMVQPVVSTLTITHDFIVPATIATPAFNFRYVRPTQDPITYTRQTDGLWETSLNFEASYDITSFIGGNDIVDDLNNLIVGRS